MTEVADAVTGIVLAGGRAPAFGDVDRMVQSYKGKPLFHHPLGVLAGVSDELIVQTRFAGGDPPLLDVPVPTRVSHDPDPARGGSGPTVALLAALRVTWSPLALVAGGDMPDLSPRVLLGMARILHGSAKTQAVVLQEAGTTFALPAAVRVEDVRAKLIEMTRPSAGEPPPLRNVFAELETVTIPDAEWKEMDPFGVTLRGIDRPEDLRI